MVDFSSKKELTPITRLFLSPDVFEKDFVFGSKEDAHYIKNVLRGKKGDQIIVLNGLGEEYRGKIEELDNKNIIIKLKEQIELDREPKSNLILAQGLCKKDKWELILQKTTELGIKIIQPFYSENSVVRFKSKKELDNKLHRWEKIVKNSSEQSERQIIPEIRFPISFQEMLEEYSKTGKKLIFNEREEHLYADLEVNGTNTQVILVVGPEGGFSEQEVKSAKDYGYNSVGLGKRILRTETAAIVVTAITLFWLGEMGG